MEALLAQTPKASEPEEEEEQQQQRIASGQGASSSSSSSGMGVGSGATGRGEGLDWGVQALQQQLVSDWGGQDADDPFALHLPTPHAHQELRPDWPGGWQGEGAGGHHEGDQPQQQRVQRGQGARAPGKRPFLAGQQAGKGARSNTRGALFPKKGRPPQQE